MTPPLRVAIRADASRELGSGHVMRSLALAQALRAAGGEALFLCRELPGDCCAGIERQGFPVHRLPGERELDPLRDAEQSARALPGGVQWLIVDHYGLDASWERLLRPHAGRIMAIDDQANRPHDCDLLLDQNLFRDPLRRYRGLVPPHCRLFLGPRYALLREEFIAARRTLRRRSGTVRRLLLFFGGSDPTNETEKALLALQQLRLPGLHVDAVVGAANPRADRVRALCAALPRTSFHCDISNMAQLMAAADLALGAGGSATWERCYLGLPSLVVVVAENQAAPARAALQEGLILSAADSREVTAASLATAVDQALRSPLQLLETSRRCLRFMEERHAALHPELAAALAEVPRVA